MRRVLNIVDIVPALAPPTVVVLDDEAMVCKSATVVERLRLELPFLDPQTSLQIR